MTLSINQHDRRASATARSKFPPNILGKQCKLALLFKNLATLRIHAPLFKKVETLH